MSYKVALVHDFLAEYGGAERVVEALHQLFPKAPLYVAFADLSSFGSQRKNFSKMDIRFTWLQYIPFVSRWRSPLRLLAPGAFAKLNLSTYDVVVSSSNAYHAKSVKVPKGVHLCYCHTPPRSLYGFDASSNWQKNPLVKLGGQLINHFLRQKDFLAAQKIDQIIVNSQTVAQRVKKYWRRESVVIYPPVALVEKAPKISPLKKRNYYLFVNRLNYAKHPEIAIQACLDLHLPLKIVGVGPLRSSLEQLSQKDRTSQIEFLGGVGDEELVKLYSGAKAVLYPVIDEDFGIVPIEAMAFGTPVIAHRSGGPTETIIENKTGVFFDDLKVASLKEAIQRAEQISFDFQTLHRQALKFSQKNFQDKILNLVEKTIANKRK